MACQAEPRPMGERRLADDLESYDGRPSKLDCDRFLNGGRRRARPLTARPIRCEDVAKSVGGPLHVFFNS